MPFPSDVLRQLKFPNWTKYLLCHVQRYERVFVNENLLFRNGIMSRSTIRDSAKKHANSQIAASIPNALKPQYHPTAPSSAVNPLHRIRLSSNRRAPSNFP